MVSGHAVVAGGGIGGLAAAIALREAGLGVTVLERSPELQPIGAGLSIWPNGVRALRSLGLGGLADPAHARPAEGALRRADGSELAAFDAAELEARFGAPLVGLHRAHLLGGLLARAEDAGAEIRWGGEVEAAEQGRVRFTGDEAIEADLIVGADGINSVIRAAILGDENPRDSGIVAWRGVASGAAATAPPGEWWGPGSAAGVLPLAGDRTYWYVAYRGGIGDAAELERRLEPFGPPIHAIVAATPERDRLCHGLYDRDPASHWSSGTLTLLGDAAHPMLPFLGQGACSALEDAVALGAALADSDSVEAALAAYEGERRPRTAKLVKGSRQAGKAALAESSVARAIRDRLVAVAPAGLRLRQLEPIVGKG
jgi:2-polyprenyl-6-methoxyphenol hydroxylase-like FAD-dependent oxidoreductase